MTFPEFIELQKKWNNVFEPLTTGLKFEPLITGLENLKFADFVIPEKHLRSSLLDLDKLALKYGWISDWGDSTPAETDDLLKEWSDIKSSKEQERIVSQFFIEYYSNNDFSKLEVEMRNWVENPIFTRRMQIFQDCLIALKHKNASFNSSNLIVPVLISQSDGIIGELIEREGWIYTEIVNKKGKKVKKWMYPNHSTEDNPERCFGNIIKNKRNRLGSTYIGNLVQTNSRYEIFNEGLFQQAFHGEGLKNPSFLSRHKILHGEDIEYGTLENAIKLFLILNYLSKFSVSNLIDPDDSDLVEFRELSSFNSERSK
jgi:hypothetical protein